MASAEALTCGSPSRVKIASPNSCQSRWRMFGDFLTSEFWASFGTSRQLGTVIGLADILSAVTGDVDKARSEAAYRLTPSGPNGASAPPTRGTVETPTILRCPPRRTTWSREAENASRAVGTRE